MSFPFIFEHDGDTYMLLNLVNQEKFGSISVKTFPWIGHSKELLLKMFVLRTRWS